MLYVLACLEVPAIAITNSCYKGSHRVFLSWKEPGAELVLLLSGLFQWMLSYLSPWVSGIHYATCWAQTNMGKQNKAGSIPLKCVCSALSGLFVLRFFFFLPVGVKAPFPLFFLLLS